MEKKFRITVDGRQYDVTVEDLSETPSYTIPSPGDMSVPTTSTSAPASSPPPTIAPGAAGPGDEVCPLAGVVISIEVTPGQAVKEGDKVMTVEAMKMKTAVISHHNGQVKNIAVKVGDAVEAGQVLLTIG
ncbi:MAG: biotin/lipoyl-containing protein [Gammaproteobacteria bacterium]|jgi:biotin carboxyl carrier protein